MDLQLGKMAFASLQRWWMLSKHVPNGVCASDPARMLLPCWCYQGIAGRGDGFWLILSGWKSTCASWRRGQCVCLSTGLIPRRNFLLARRENKKLGGFPLEFGGKSLLSWKPEPPWENNCCLQPKEIPKFFEFFPVYTNLFCFLSLRQVSDYDPAWITPCLCSDGFCVGKRRAVSLVTKPPRS